MSVYRLVLAVGGASARPPSWVAISIMAACATIIVIVWVMRLSRRRRKRGAEVANESEDHR